MLSLIFCKGSEFDSASLGHERSAESSERVVFSHVVVVSDCAWDFRQMDVVIDQYNVNLRRCLHAVLVGYILEGEPPHADVFHLTDFIEIVTKCCIRWRINLKSDKPSPFISHGVLTFSPTIPSRGWPGRTVLFFRFRTRGSGEVNCLIEHDAELDPQAKASFGDPLRKPDQRAYKRLWFFQVIHKMEFLGGKSG